MPDIEMPQLGETVTEGTITQWFKSVGDTVETDEPLFEVSTDKVDSEVPSPVSGTLTEIVVEEGDTVDVGTVLARVGEGDGAAPAEQAPAEEAPSEEAPAEEAPSEEEPPRPEPEPRAEAAPEAEEPRPEPAAQPEPEPRTEPRPEPEPAPEPAPAAEGDGRAAGKLLSPVVRRLVNEHDLDPASIEGTGAGGRITRSDVQRVIESGARRVREAPAERAPPAAEPEAPARRPAPAPARAPAPGERDTTVPHSNIRKRTAEHMRRSLDTSAHVYSSIEVDFEKVERVRRARREPFKAEEGFSLTYLPFVARAVIDAVRDYPEVNASFGEHELVVHGYVNLGVAVDLDFEGLLAPVITDADDKRLRAIAREVHDLATRARSKQLSPDELAGGTLTITNPGPFGTTMTLPIINQPQVAILSTDAVTRKPVVVEGADGSEAVAVHSVGMISITWDHRAFDGAYAASFLRAVKENLETMDWEQELA